MERLVISRVIRVTYEVPLTSYGEMTFEEAAKYEEEMGMTDILETLTVVLDDNAMVKAEVLIIGRKD